MILGIDIGTSSIGWSLLATDSDGSPNGIVDVGVRIFPAGVDGNIDSGREEPRNLKRRDARSARRLGWREGRRHRRCVSILQSMGLLLKPRTSSPPHSIRCFKSWTRSFDQRTPTIARPSSGYTTCEQGHWMSDWNRMSSAEPSSIS